MATVNGTIKSVDLVQASFGGRGARKTYHIGADYGIFTGSADTVILTGVTTKIQEHTRNGKTVTLRQAMSGQPGKNAAGADVYAIADGVVTIDGASVSFKLGGVTAEASTTTASTGVGFLITVDES
jgi:hypothetical protein